jgi:molybdopterin-guanine dinucleotide biosynthesis protein A
MKKITTDDVSVVILAGGKGRRMGGQDKGLVEYQGRPLVQHVLEKISPQASHIAINANRNHPAYRQFGYPVIADTLDDFQGPLAGFLAALSAVQTDYILTLPCDGPLVAQDYVHKMIDACNAELAGGKRCDIAVATDGAQLQPVYALIATSLKASLVDFLQSDERKILRWFQQHPHIQVEFADDKMFTNINTREELEA